MKKMAAIIFIVLLLPGYLSAKENRTQGEQPLFLAYNIWKTPNYSNQKCINYKVGRLIPAGTEVVNAHVYEEVDQNGMFPESEFKIDFKIKETGKHITIGYTKKWHPGKTIYSYYDLMFTSKKFSELVAGFNESEIKSIRAGHLTPGMSKDAVLIAYGYPPEHATPDFANNDYWVYWRNKFGKKAICFNSQGRTIKCTEVNIL